LIFFSSDPHFGHARILEFCKDTRPFKNVEEHDHVLIQNHNQVVGPDDDVYFLGDLGFLQATQISNIIQKLNGRKYLIAGNHDHRFLKHDKAHRVFEWVKDYHVIREKDFQIVLFHFPIWEWDQMHRGAIHLHGHVHGKPTGIPGKIMDVSLDSLAKKGFGLRPVSIEEVLRFTDKLPIRTHH